MPEGEGTPSIDLAPPPVLEVLPPTSTLIFGRFQNLQIAGLSFYGVIMVHSTGWMCQWQEVESCSASVEENAISRPSSSLSCKTVVRVFFFI